MSGEAYAALSLLALAFAHLNGLPRPSDEKGDDELAKKFQALVIDPLRQEPTTDGHELARRFFDCRSEDDLAAARFSFDAGCAFLAQAQNENSRPDRNEKAVWSFLCDAHQWGGVAMACLLTSSAPRETLRALARKAATARHAENRAMKDQVFDWCDAHASEHKSMDSMAQAVAGKLVPVAFRTARTWVGQWKKLQPARTQ